MKSTGKARRQLRQRSWVVCLTLAMVASLMVPSPASADLLPEGFAQELITGLGEEPTGLRVSPDGRVFVLEHLDTGPTSGDGIVRVIENGVAVPAPFMTIPVERGGGQEGLQDLAFHPDFPATPYVYVSYTNSSPSPHNRISRWQVSGNTVVGAEEVIFELPAYPGTTDTHFGGSIVFGSDDKLYWSIGDHQDPTLVQRFDTLFGKVLRINPDGSIPSDNPFYNTLTDDFRAIYALGLRNPWKMSHDPASGAIHIQDVGAGTWEEINVLSAGANFGWPIVEGPGGGGTYVDPLRAFNHTTGTPFACAIAGGDFYSPDVATFPAEYVGDYLVGEFCNSWIYRMDLATGDLFEFSDETEVLPGERCSSCGQFLDLKTAPNGDIWQLRRIDIDNTTETRVFRTTYIGNGIPFIGAQPADTSAVAGTSVELTVLAFGQDPLSYQWQKDQVDIPGATDRDLLLTGVQAVDDGSMYRVIVTNALGTITSDEATLTILPGNAPTGSIDSPAVNSTYTGGSTISFSGSGTDVEDGTLPASAYEWSVIFHHDEHTHPFVGSLPGVTSGSVVVPDIGETETTVFYRINLTLTDSDGAQTFYSRDVLPQLTQITLATEPAGLLVALDGQPQVGPIVSEAVVGVERILTAPLSQSFSGEDYVFAGWSNNKGATHTIAPPGSNSTYTATYRLAVDPPTVPFMPGHVILDDDAGELVSADLPSDLTGSGDIDIVINIAMDDWTPASTVALFGSNKATLSMLLDKNGRLRLLIKQDGSLAKAKSAPLEFLDGQATWLRMTFDGGTGEVMFFESPSTEVDPLLVGDWEQIGSTATTNTNDLNRPIDEVVIGNQKPGGKNGIEASVYGAAFWYDGALQAAVDFTSDDDLTSTPPDFTEWGEWILTNADYLESEGSSGPGYVWFAGLSGDQARTAVTPVPDTDFVDARVRVSLNDWTPDDIQAMMGANSSNLKFEVATNGRLRFRLDTINDTIQATSTAAPTIPADGVLWLRATYDVNTSIVRFYTSTSSESVGENVATWTQLGAFVDMNDNDPLEPDLEELILGGGNTNGASGGFNPMVGQLFGATLIHESTVITSIDFSNEDALTTIAPDYSGWGDYVVQGQLWQYIPESN
jgi:glucose/arabinose dehydrogenase